MTLWWLGIVAAAHVRRGVAPLADLRPRLHLTQEPNWGYQLRYGLIPLDAHDVQLIKEAMGA